MSCYPTCPDCKCDTVDEAASAPSTGGSTKAAGAACVCYPANERCPSHTVCKKDGHPEYLRFVDEIRALHVVKSAGYGNDSDPMANFTAVASLTGQPRYLYPVHRSIEKLTRVLSLHEQGRKEELKEEFLDVASLLLCAAAMLRDDS